MRVVERMQLLEDIGTELQNRYTWSDVISFVRQCGVKIQNPEDYEGPNSKRCLAKFLLEDAKEFKLTQIASELDISIDTLIMTPPKNWIESKAVKAFISHIAKDKDKATRLKEALAVYNIEAFVAHEDILPTEEWVLEIERALKSMDFFISIHTKGFTNSLFCQQEIGFAVCRNMKIIPIKFDEDPPGFIARKQALLRSQKTADDIANEIVDLLRQDSDTQDIYQKITDYIEPQLANEGGYSEIPF